MKYVLPALFAVFILTSCSPSRAPKPEILLKIDNYSMTTDEFAEELRSVSEFRRAGRAKEQLLNDIIEKKLLLLEAQRQGLDKEPDFMRMIQRFWEQSLLRVMVEKKMREFCPGPRPTETEKAATDSRFDEWQASLKSRAKIYINRDALGKITFPKDE